ncbi:hypothetical protein [Pseudonocardia alni]|uniref:hypothetical protein n=1 Tax=Pseudonocardia alni TaxID=33907 RepID=UPI001AD6EACB|nr:hypothetical protein [Pseudonocardia alni]MBO4239903.1 hypothetical protein [Pseudonocardia alni]
MPPPGGAAPPPGGAAPPPGGAPPCPGRAAPGPGPEGQRHRAGRAEEPRTAAAFRLAWSGADPGPTDHAARPAEATTAARPVPLPRDGTGTGALLALSLAADPDRVVGGVRLRRVPSAGGRYPVDARVGARVYDPLAHALDGGPADPGADDHADLVLHLAPERTTWRYGPRSLPVLLLDLGHAAAAVLAAAATLRRPRTAHLVPDGDCSRVVLTSGPGPDGAVPLGASADPHPAAVLRARRSAPFASLRPPVADPGLDRVARTRLGAGQHAALLDAGHPLAAALTRRACGLPDLTGVGGLLVVTGDVDPGPDTVAQHVRAGLAVHDAWLTATAAGLTARPVGCWVEAVLHGPGGRGRVHHALALGA